MAVSAWGESEVGYRRLKGRGWDERTVGIVVSKRYMHVNICERRRR